MATAVQSKDKMPSHLAMASSLPSTAVSDCPWVEVELLKSLGFSTAPAVAGTLCTVTCDVAWEVPAFLASRLTLEQSLGEVLTLLAELSTRKPQHAQNT